MRFTRKLVFIWRNIWGKMSFLIGVVSVALLVGLNVWNLHDYRFPNEFSKYFINERMLMLLPVGICVLMIALEQYYLCEGGRELLYLYRKDIYAEYVLVFAFYELLMTIDFVVFYHFLMELPLEVYIRYFLLVFCLAGIILVLSYRIKKTMTVAVVMLVFYVFEFVIEQGSLNLPCLFSWNYYSSYYLLELVFFLVVGGFGWVKGYRQMKGYADYDE